MLFLCDLRASAGNLVVCGLPVCIFPLVDFERNVMSLDYNVRSIGQHNSKVCWFACYRMLYSWKKVPDKKCWERLRAANVSLKQALYHASYSKARDALKLTSHRVGYLKTFDDFVYTIKTYGPMWCAGNFMNGSGHVILVTGVFPEKNEIRMIDPWQVHKGTTSEIRNFSWWKKNVFEITYACQTWK
jgi:hypothetical protein